MAHYKLRQCRTNNLTLIDPFSCTYIKKTKFASNQGYALLRKIANVHGNVMHIANLLTSIKDKDINSSKLFYLTLFDFVLQTYYFAYVVLI